MTVGLHFVYEGYSVGFHVTPIRRRARKGLLHRVSNFRKLRGCNSETKYTFWRLFIVCRPRTQRFAVSIRTFIFTRNFIKIHFVFYITPVPNGYQQEDEDSLRLSSDVHTFFFGCPRKQSENKRTEENGKPRWGNRKFRGR